MEQRSKKGDIKIEELYDHISISHSFHDRALANLKRAEREHNSMKKNNVRVTHIEELRKPKQNKGKFVAAGFIVALLIGGIAVIANMVGNNDKRGNNNKHAAMQQVTPTPTQGSDVSLTTDQNMEPMITPLPIQGEDVYLDIDMQEKLEEQRKLKELLYLIVTQPDGYEEVEKYFTIKDGKANLIYYNGKNYEVYKVIETIGNPMDSSLVVVKSHGKDMESLKEDDLLICQIDMNLMQKDNVIEIPLTNMTYKLIYQDQRLSQIQYMDPTDTVRGTFTWNGEQWIADDNALIQILAIKICNAYFSGDIDQVKELVASEDIIACEKNILDSMQPYLIKWDPKFVTREELFGVSCQFYGPQDEDSYSYLSLDIQYENERYVVKSMALEK
ncbi:MAG: hypothetical protein PUC65_00940 [Clostridiales bacterium]|nr:hypothetical protein [Clostridiales bacterium]